MPHAEHFILARDGLRLFEHRWLPGGEPRAVAAVVHGFCEHGGRYERLAGDLNRHGFAVCALDLRGHGRSEGDRAWVRTFDEYLDDLEVWHRCIVARWPQKPLFLLGHSMGGVIVARFAATRSPHVQGLILDSTTASVGDGVFPLLRRLAALFSVVSPRLRIARMGCRSMSRDPEVIKAFERDPLVFHGRFPVRTGAEILRAADALRRDANRLTLPLLLLHGTEDRAADPAGSRLLYERAGSSDKTLRLYPGLAHDLLNEPERDQVLADLLAWLEERSVDSGQ